MEINLESKQVIEGSVSMADESVTIDKVSVLSAGQLFVEVPVVDGKFKFEIDDRFENGSYDVVAIAMKDGKELTVKDSFIVSNDGIDPSLPTDMQYLKNEI